MAKRGRGRRPGTWQRVEIHRRSHHRANRPSGRGSRGAIHRRHADPCQHDPGRYYDRALGGHGLGEWRRRFRQRRGGRNGVAYQPSRHPQYRQQRCQSRRLGDAKRRGRISRRARGPCRRRHGRDRAPRQSRRDRRHLQRRGEPDPRRRQCRQCDRDQQRCERDHHGHAGFDDRQPAAVRRADRRSRGSGRAAARAREHLHRPGRNKPRCGKGQQRQPSRHYRHRPGRHQSGEHGKPGWRFRLSRLSGTA